MRIVLNILAVACAILCGLLGAVSLLLLASMWANARIQALAWPSQAIIALTALTMAAAGLFFAWRLIGHLRQPNQDTARRVFAVACFLLGVQLINLIHGRTNKGDRVDYFANPTDVLGSLAGGLALIVLYKLVLKSLATRAYPSVPPAPSSKGQRPHNHGLHG